MWRLLALMVLPLAAARADVSACACDPAQPATLEARPCSLCREAERQPLQIPFFFVKDNNPRKPHRWLLLPRAHHDGPEPLKKFTAAERTAFWKAAIVRARELFGEEWGLAFNGDRVRTQCHSHVHIGRLLKGVETANFVVVRGPAQIPLPKDGTGLWIHPAAGGLHVHLGEQTCETVLFR